MIAPAGIARRAGIHVATSPSVGLRIEQTLALRITQRAHRQPFITPATIALAPLASEGSAGFAQAVTGMHRALAQQILLSDK